MSLRTKVIINEVTNLSDARYCAGMAVDYIGFRIDEDHPKYINPENFKEITDWVAGVEFLGETSKNQDQSSLSHTVSGLMIDDVNAINTYEGEPSFWSVDVNNLSEGQINLLKSNSLKVQGIILHKSSDVITDEDKKVITSLANHFEVFIGYGIDDENVLSILQELPISGIALRGSDEIRPGYKDYDQLADILEKLELDD